VNHVECPCGAEFATIHELLEHRKTHGPVRVWRTFAGFNGWDNQILWAIPYDVEDVR